MISMISRSLCKSTFPQAVLPLDGKSLQAFAFADLFRGEPASANTAAPSGGWKRCGPWHNLNGGKPGSHQLAIALGTLSLNHGVVLCAPCVMNSARVNELQGGSCETPQPSAGKDRSSRSLSDKLCNSAYARRQPMSWLRRRSGWNSHRFPQCPCKLRGCAGARSWLPVSPAAG